MLLVLAVHYHLSKQVQALPISAFDNDGFITSTCDDIHNSRTIWDIIWSCLATIFSCTWVAIHPNVPGPDERSLAVTSRRVGITVMALIMPELVIMWAMGQWFIARQLAKKYHEKGWTQTHGFFALMGGFLLFDSVTGRPLEAIIPEELDNFVRDGRIDFPNITEKEIEARSKGDMLSKGLAIIQTGWFVLQCIARGVERLPVTELELMTVAYAVLNLVAYMFWWNKPLNVQCHFLIPRKGVGEDNTVREGEGMREGEILQKGEGGSRGAGVSVHEGEGVGKDSGQGISNDGDLDISEDKSRVLRAIKRAMQGPPAFNVRKSLEAIINSQLVIAREILLLWPFVGLSRGVGNSLGDKATRVPTFYRGGENKLQDARVMKVVVFAITTVFGAIHCIAWSFQFPSHPEQIIWRVSSLLITCLPLSFWIMARSGLSLGSNLRILMTFIFISHSSLYVLARYALMIEAFVTLRSLPPGAYQTVHWTTLIPHV